MSKRTLILVGGGVAAGLVAALLFLVLQNPSNREPRLVTTASPSPGLGSPAPAPHEEADDSHQAEANSNPILRALPHQTPHWVLDFDGSQGDRYKFLATVWYVPGREDPNSKIAEQRPFVEAFIRGTGQPDGTYVVEFVAAPPPPD